jgi:hypothetical protein
MMFSNDIQPIIVGFLPGAAVKKNGTLNAGLRKVDGPFCNSNSDRYPS